MNLDLLRKKRGFICGMDTDIIAGIHSDIDTVLVLSGVTSEEDLKHFAYHPRYVLSGVGDIPG
jgi:NagD protein